MKAAVELAMALDRLAAVRDALRTITADADVKRAGTNAHLLAWLLKCSPAKTQTDLAGRLGVSTARVSQMLKVLKRAYR